MSLHTGLSSIHGTARWLSEESTLNHVIAIYFVGLVVAALLDPLLGVQSMSGTIGVVNLFGGFLLGWVTRRMDKQGEFDDE